MLRCKGGIGQKNNYDLHGSHILHPVLCYLHLFPVSLSFLATSR
jgi:hypothetical protein